MFATFLFFAFFVVGCLLVAEPTPQVAAVVPVPVEDDLPSLKNLLVEAEALTARPVPAVAAAVAAPVAVSVVKVEVEALTKPIAEMNSAELRKECSRRGIAWRNTHGQAKHLKKGEMVVALS